MDPITWLAGTFIGPRLAKPVAIGFAILIGVALIFALGRCSHHDNSGEVAQVKQTTRSSDAIATAASEAIDTIGGRVATEHNVDLATAQAIQEIGNAADPDSVRTAVINGVCRQKSHRFDPACAK